ncbi:deoxyuridine 5'-triphosphate nucleotidohydrolase [Halobacteriales archaeon QS_8_69_26]|nr:MAG: deoxyuridine 5'-triphosphate nucleotidohydrolase [Halobacteriales archaeon QS_8_69_26]
MFRSGAFVADHVSPVNDEQVQPNGVDLTLEAVFEQRDSGWIGRDAKTVGDRQAVEPDEVGEQVPETYYLTPGGYVVRYAETVSIPREHVGFLYPRSTLLRNSCMLNTAVWDAGYEGKGEGLLQVHNDVAIERGARVAQLVLAAADHQGTYAGDYQGEHI